MYSFFSKIFKTHEIMPRNEKKRKYFIKEKMCAQLMSIFFLCLPFFLN